MTDRPLIDRLSAAYFFFAALATLLQLLLAKFSLLSFRASFCSESNSSDASPSSLSRRDLRVRPLAALVS